MSSIAAKLRAMYTKDVPDEEEDIIDADAGDDATKAKKRDAASL